MKLLLCIVAVMASGRPALAFAPSITSSSNPALVSPSWSKQKSSRYAVAFGNRHHSPPAQNKKTREERFERVASKAANTQAPCIIEIDGMSYNLTAWAKAHPAGEKILLRFHGKDATKAFHAAGHSKKAYEMLKDFAVQPSSVATTPAPAGDIPRWRKKLFTKEDPIGVHKYLGVYVLLHFIFRFGQMYVGDASCGLGTRLGKGPSVWPALCLVPHALLSLSSLIFHTVPRERVIGMPMIWSGMPNEDDFTQYDTVHRKS